MINMMLADKIQLIILVILAVTAIIALYEIRATKKIHEDTLIWNKKNRTYNTLGEIRQIKQHLSKAEFKDLQEVPVTLIPLERIKESIKKDPKIKAEIIEYLNHHEGIANGITHDLLDEEMVKSNRFNSFRQVYNQDKEYIDYRRTFSGKKAWKEFELLVTKRYGTV